METYQGKVQTPQDAIILFEACRLGLTPRVQRRLSEKERQQIKSGSVFVWDEREAGMRRWTDGKSWSASRVSGSFLTYREMEGKRGGTGLPPAVTPPAPVLRKSNSGTRSSGNSNNGGSDDDEEGPDGYRYKPDGLMKQSFSITTSDGRHLHLISYFARNPSMPLKQPTTDPQLRNVVPTKGMYPEATVNEATNIPAVTRGPMAGVSPHPPAHPPPQMYVAAYPYPPPPGYQAGPMHHHYPPQGWPPSPGHMPPGPPPGAFYYPAPPGYPPGYMHPQSPYAPSPYSYAHPAPHPAQERGPPPPPQSSLPPLIGQNSPSGGQWPAARQSSATYAQSMPPAASLRESYSRSAAEQRSEEVSRAPGPQLAPVAAFQNKPLTPPASRSGATPPTKSSAVETPQIRDANTAITPVQTFPSIKTLINNDMTTLRREEDRTRTRSRSRSPVGSRIRDVPSAMAAGGRERDRSDLKRLDAQLLKSSGPKSSGGKEISAQNPANASGGRSPWDLSRLKYMTSAEYKPLLDSLLPRAKPLAKQLDDMPGMQPGLGQPQISGQPGESGLAPPQAGLSSPNGNEKSVQDRAIAFGGTDPRGGPSKPILRMLPAGLFPASLSEDKKLQLQTMTDENYKRIVDKLLQRVKRGGTFNGMPAMQPGLSQPQISGQPQMSGQPGPSGLTPLQSNLNSSNDNENSTQNGTNAFGGADPHCGHQKPSRNIPDDLRANMPDKYKRKLMTLNDERYKEIIDYLRANMHKQGLMVNGTPLDARAVNSKLSILDKALKDEAPASTIIEILNEFKTGVVPSEKLLLEETRIRATFDKLCEFHKDPNVMTLSREIWDGWLTAIWTRPDPLGNEESCPEKPLSKEAKRHKFIREKSAATVRSYEALMSRPAWMDAKLGPHPGRKK